MTSLTEGEGPRALVVGTGLIGGSIALALRRRGWHVTGTDADGDRLAEALRSGVVDQAGDDLDAGVVFIAVPAAAVADEARRILATPGRRPGTNPRRRRMTRKTRESRAKTAAPAITEVRQPRSHAH